MKKLVFFFLVVAFGCQQPAPKDSVPYTRADFETTIQGKQTELYTLTNSNGMRVDLTNFGAKIVAVFVPDKNGELDDVVQGFKSVKAYQKGQKQYGAVIGPYANRIGNAQFEIAGQVYHLDSADHGNCLHSGPDSFDRQVYSAKKIDTANGEAVVMHLHRNDGDSGFPGNKDFQITYTLTNANELKLDYQATTDKACPFNLTNHSYFNLHGESKGTILDHEVMIDADSTTEVDAELIPTGKIISIRGTDMDFTTSHTIRERINSDFEPIKLAGGYDQNYILNKDQHTGKMTFCASVYEPQSGRLMQIYTTEPAVQFYSGNFQDGTLEGKYGRKFYKNSGLCMETQHYPDSPNHPKFPTTILLPGDTLHSTTIFKFSVK